MCGSRSEHQNVSAEMKKKDCPNHPSTPQIRGVPYTHEAAPQIKPPILALAFRLSGPARFVSLSHKNPLLRVSSKIAYSCFRAASTSPPTEQVRCQTCQEEHEQPRRELVQLQGQQVLVSLQGGLLLVNHAQHGHFHCHGRNFNCIVNITFFK